DVGRGPGGALALGTRDRSGRGDRPDPERSPRRQRHDARPRARVAPYPLRTTMKLSLLFPAILLAAACGSTENGPPAPPGPPPPSSTDNPPPTPPPPPPGGPVRTLVDKPIMPTSPDNLVNDPEFE